MRAERSRTHPHCTPHHPPPPSKLRRNKNRGEKPTDSQLSSSRVSQRREQKPTPNHNKHTHSLTHTHKHLLNHTHTLTKSHTHTLNYTHTLIQSPATYTLTQTHTLSDMLIHMHRRYASSFSMTVSQGTCLFLLSLSLSLALSPFLPSSLPLHPCLSISLSLPFVFALPLLHPCLLSKECLFIGCITPHPSQAFKYAVMLMPGPKACPFKTGHRSGGVRGQRPDAPTPLLPRVPTPSDLRSHHRP